MTGATTLAFRQRLAQTAYARTAAYDAAVSTWMAGAIGERGAAAPGLRRNAGAGPALWREPASGGGLLHATARPGPAWPRRGSCRARS